MCVFSDFVHKRTWKEWDNGLFWPFFFPFVLFHFEFVNEYWENKAMNTGYTYSSAPGAVTDFWRDPQGFFLRTEPWRNRTVLMIRGSWLVWTIAELTGSDSWSCTGKPSRTISESSYVFPNSRTLKFINPTGNILILASVLRIMVLWVFNGLIDLQYSARTFGTSEVELQRLNTFQQVASDRLQNGQGKFNLYFKFYCLIKNYQH